MIIFFNKPGDQEPTFNIEKSVPQHTVCMGSTKNGMTAYGLGSGLITSNVQMHELYARVMRVGRKGNNGLVTQPKAAPFYRQFDKGSSIEI